MKTKATINLLGKTETGVSQSTGNQWSAKEVVFEVNREDGRADTIAARTMNKDIITKLEQVTEGDQVTVELGFQSRARTFTRKDGTEAIIRSTEVFIRSIDTDNTPL